jgi:hypothetical protein
VLKKVDRKFQHGDVINCDKNTAVFVQRKGNALGYHGSKWGYTPIW